MNELREEMQNDENILVLVRYNSEYRWYVSDREYWLMDYAKYAHQFDDDNHDFSDRFNVAIVNEETADIFFEYMAIFEVDRRKLYEVVASLRPLTSWDDSSFLFPALFVDFDDRKLYSVYSKSLLFQNYVPEGWQGTYEDFYRVIPDREKYWIRDGEDLFQTL